MTFSIGLDIGATKIHGAVVDDDGAIVAEVRAATEPGTEGVVRSAAGVVEELRATVGEVSGPIGLGAHVLTGVDDLAYLSIGTGLAAGLMLGGALRRGDHGAAGEIGHIPVDPAGAPCSCGQRGCLETIVSGSALASAWPAADGVPPAQALFAAAGAGDPAAVAVRDRFAAGMADAVRVVGLTVDPKVIVLGGGVSALGEPLRDTVAGALRAQATTSEFLASLDLAGRIRVVPAGVPVAALGAAMLGRAR